MTICSYSHSCRKTAAYIAINLRWAVNKPYCKEHGELVAAQYEGTRLEPVTIDTFLGQTN